MITLPLLLLAVSARAAELPPLPGMGGASPAVAVSTPTPAAAAPEAPKKAEKPVLMPPKIPARPAGTLDTAAAVANDLAVRVQYFEDGQSYYRAYTKGGSHSVEENKAFVQFLEEYERELEIARKVHSLLGVWLDKKSAVKD